MQPAEPNTTTGMNRPGRAVGPAEVAIGGAIGHPPMRAIALRGARLFLLAKWVSIAGICVLAGDAMALLDHSAPPAFLALGLTLIAGSAVRRNLRGRGARSVRGEQPQRRLSVGRLGPV